MGYDYIWEKKNEEKKERIIYLFEQVEESEMGCGFVF